MLVLVGTTAVLTCDGLRRANDDGQSGTLEMWIVNNKTYELEEYSKEKHGIFYRCLFPPIRALSLFRPTRALTRGGGRVFV
jgi:hypothetical protein